MFPWSVQTFEQFSVYFTFITINRIKKYLTILLSDTTSAKPKRSKILSFPELRSKTEDWKSLFSRPCFFVDALRIAYILII